MNKRFILSPCGTSLFTNEISDPQKRSWIGKNANAKNPEEIPDDQREYLKQIAQHIEKKLLSSDNATITRMSAELNTIVKIYEDNNFQHKGDYHILLCTDTWIGETTAKLVEKWLLSKNFQVHIYRQKDLRTDDITSFQQALAEIVKWCQEEIAQYQKRGYYVIFNLTGGFKSVQGFLQTLATFYADETVYIFETSKDLLRIPKLPVVLKEEDSIRDHLTTFRRLSLDLQISPKQKCGIPEIFLLQIEDEITLSPWGELVWQQNRANIYREKVHSSPSPKIKFGKNFHKTTSSYDADRLIHINQRIDDLARFLESEAKSNINRLDFKKTKSKKLQTSTHEIDAWADQDAKRMYGHFENDVFVLDAIDHALH